VIVRISAEAERDLEDIADYIAKDNPVRAMTFVQELRAEPHRFCRRLIGKSYAAPFAATVLQT
jgi:plasmid stabilization system protein ParE